MATVSYIAKRNIKRLDFNKENIMDVSLSVVDNSINSINTDLSGLLTGNWIKLIDSTSNDGWYRVLSASTTNKIIFDDTLRLLANEAQGTVLSLEGYDKGYAQTYVIEFNLKKKNYRLKTHKTENKAIDGSFETLFNHQVETYDIETTLVSDVDIYNEWLTFIASVSAGESFLLDFEGSIASPALSETFALLNDVSFFRITNFLLQNIRFTVQRL